MRRRLAVAVLSACALAVAPGSGCLPGAGPPLLDPADGSGSSTNLEGDAGLPRSDVDLGDPFAIEGLSPSHGPFTGGTRTVLAGRGLRSKLRVFFGGVEVPQANVVASSPTRAAIVTPPGPAGDVEIRILDEAAGKERRLPRGFTYDAFVVQPDSGATSGGTRIALTGNGTSWDASTTVAIGGSPCKEVVAVSAAKLECLTPPGTPGAKDVTVTTSDAKSMQAREAFTYSDSSDGYRGGLSGGALSGRLRVLALDSYTGQALGSASVVAGSSLPGAAIQQTSLTGVTEFNGLTATKVTVTVTAKCHQPMTFVDVPVDTVTAYLTPVLDPSCGMSDPPSTGGRGGKYGGVIEGQLVFPGSAEFQRQGWTNVPLPNKPTERRAAYVFQASGSPADEFQLPPASAAITPEENGTTGYSYSLVVYPGNVTIYVVAGLEDRSQDPPAFMPYVMGIARGVAVPAQTRVTGVDVQMNVLFDHTVTMGPEPPAQRPRGPDRFAASVSMTLGAFGYAALPRGQRVLPFPVAPTIPFVGVPSLDYAAAGEQYVLSAIAATGSDLGRPASFVSRIRTSETNAPIGVGGFLGVPVLSEPGTGTWSGTHVAFDGASGPVDLTLVQISSGAGLVSWTIVAPGAATSIDLPDLGAVPDPEISRLVRGPIVSTVYVARIDGFQYGRLRTGQLSQGAWNAGAFDSRAGAH